MDKNQNYGKGVFFERIRRITGYLVGNTSRWNNAKKAELHDRVKHSLSGAKQKEEPHEKKAD